MIVLMHSGAAYIISNVIITILWFLGTGIVLESRYGRVRTFLLEVAIQLSVWYIFENRLAVFSYLRIFSGILLPVVLTVLFHKGSVLFKIITALLFFMSTLFSETIMAAFLPYDLVISGELFQRYDVIVYSVYVMLTFSTAALITAVLKAVQQHSQGLLVEKQWLLFFLFPLSQILSMVGLWNSYMDFDVFGNPYKVVFLTVFNILADAALIYTIVRTAHNAELRIRNTILEDQINSQEDHYAQLSSVYHDIRKMRHDIDNHIYAVRSLIENGETEKASKYLDTLNTDREREKEMMELRFYDCRNTVVASYLDRKIRTLQEQSVSIDTDLHLPEDLSISNPDLICIFGNLLDNASEACRELDSPSITLKANYKEPYLIITCSNPYIGSNSPKHRRIRELDRGMGFAILSKLADQYDGRFTASGENGIFTAKIILKTGIEKEGGHADDSRL